MTGFEYATDANGVTIEAKEIPVARPRHPLWADLTVRGNGERIVDEHGDYLRYAPGEGWFEWDGARWKRDLESHMAKARAKGTLVRMQLTASAPTQADKKHVRSSQSSSAWVSALAAASVCAPIATSHEAFDDGKEAPEGHGDRLNTSTGTIRLSTGELHPHRREDMITKIATVRFEPGARGDVWLPFLGQVQPDLAVRTFLQRLAGYWLCGNVRDEIFPIFWGTGGNGKGTFLDTIRRVMGDYAASVPEDVLTPKAGAQVHPTSKMVFKGLRLAVASETEEGAPLAVSVMKRLTGGDVIRARYMGKDFIEWEPTHKLVMMTNARPRLLGTVSAALKRRILFIGWETVIAREDADTTLKTRLMVPAEQSAVLNWMLEGYREYLRVGLCPPASVSDSTSEYLADEDTLGSFVEDRLVFGAELEITAEHLYRAYREYCKDAGDLQAVRPQDFKPAFLAREDARGVVWKRTKEARVYRGVELRPKSAEEHRVRNERPRTWEQRAEV